MQGRAGVEIQDFNQGQSHESSPCQNEQGWALSSWPEQTVAMSVYSVSRPALQNKVAPICTHMSLETPWAVRDTHR